MARANLIGTDEGWIQVTVPMDQVQWIQVPGPGGPAGSAARVYHRAAWGPDGVRAGRVFRLMPDVEPQGRMVRLLVAVSDPLALAVEPAKRRTLIFGAYVRVEIDGRELPGVIRIARTSLHDGRNVWVMSPDGKLDIRKVTIAWSGRDDVYVADGLRAGDLLVTSDLGAPVQGMALRTAADGAGKPSAAAGGAGAAGAVQEAKR